ncbi:MAG: preprotein translocase subunit YajC [Sedimentisphaerales bacterium]|nr:preprotein translocase subunit YajC [Sedimentisphaerales bacterium]
MNNIWIIAQAGEGDAIISEPITSSDSDTETMTSTDAGNGAPLQKEATKTPNMFTYLLPVVMIVMVFLMFRAPQKQKKERKKLEQSLEKNDRILTIGGIYGTIVDIKDDEVTLKVDESNNTKIKVTRSAIGRNVSKD